MYDSAFLNLFLHYISIFQVDEIIGGGGQNDMFPPQKKKIIGGGGGRLLPSSPRIDASGGQATWTSKGGCVQWRIQDLHKKRGWAEKIRARSAPCVREARASYGWGPGARPRAPCGVQGQSPCRGPRGAEPPEALEFSANKGLQDGRQE